MDASELTDESPRRCLRSGDARSSGAEGLRGVPDAVAAVAAPYGDFVPAARSGLTGKTAIGGDRTSFEGDGGSIGFSLSFASVTVWGVCLHGVRCKDLFACCGAMCSFGENCGVVHQRPCRT